VCPPLCFSFSLAQIGDTHTSPQPSPQLFPLGRASHSVHHRKVLTLFIAWGKRDTGRTLPTATPCQPLWAHIVGQGGYGNSSVIELLSQCLLGRGGSEFWDCALDNRGRLRRCNRLEDFSLTLPPVWGCMGVVNSCSHKYTAQSTV